MRQERDVELEELEQQLQVEKEKSRRSWKTNCEHLAEQDGIIASQEEVITTLKNQVAEMQSKISRDRGERGLPPPVAGSHRASERTRDPPPLSHPIPLETAEVSAGSLAEGPMSHVQ